MCGILGYIGPRSFSAEQFGLALDIMKDRGPDDRGIYEEPEVLLGHRRLAILDLSDAGHQPMASRDGRYLIVYNGEVYNYRELRRPLEDEGVAFRSNSDTEVILELYARKGPECVRDFRGMFAIAIWDTLEKTLFLARDHMGIKPLYVWPVRGGVAFSSMVKVLRALPGGPSEIDPDGVVGYLTWGNVPGPGTILKNVRSLEPSSWQLWKGGWCTEESYWSFPPPEEAVKRREEALELLRPILLEAVRLRCIADVPVGAFLSGGIDSSAVVALMRAAGQEHLHTFSISFPQTKFDEAPYALKVAEQFGTHHTNIAVSQQMVWEELDNFFAAMDQPTCDGVNTYLVSKFAKQGGLTVSLSGLGGDELFAGYPSFRRAQKVDPWLRFMPGPLAWAAGRAGRAASGRWSKLEFLDGPGRISEKLYGMSRGLFTPSQIRQLLKPEFIAQSSMGDGKQPHIPDGIPRSHRHPVHATSYYELRRYMPNQLLRDSDVFGMAHALEIRVPLIDEKLVKAVFCIRPSVILEGQPKKLLIDSLSATLPSQCTNRPKMGFTFPLALWLKASMRDPLSFQSQQDHPFLRAGLAQKVWSSYRGGKLHWSRPWALWALCGANWSV